MKDNRERVRYKSSAEKKYKQATEGFLPVRVRTKGGKTVTKYSYQGEYYYLELSSGVSFLRAKQLTAGISLITLASVVLTLLLKNELNTIYYAGGFTFMALVPLLFFFIGACKLLWVRGDLTVQQYRELRPAVFYGSMLTGILTALALAGGIVFLARKGTGPESTSLVFLLLNLLIFCLQLPVVTMHRANNYHTYTQQEKNRRA